MIKNSSDIQLDAGNAFSFENSHNYIAVYNPNQPLHAIIIDLKNQVHDCQLLLQYNNDFLSKISKRQTILQQKNFPRYLIKKEVIEYLGKESVFKTLCNEYGLQPIREQHKGNLYSSRHVEDLCIQFENNI